eukprot:CAMPEP_0118857906 /NCGR_PEP_ID=MMETSP1163-20130328/4811_1 /TAXON_ID=124430 /ORGANISM="Phaeomonas parva, Strain CCMP2877" /LENGTH=145 /DNA_ID=CAMNT_0006791287 /DNA_START=324 /DNA_END=758 /DNA_ORIENTATION=+
MSTKRLQKELRDIETAPLDFCSFSLAQEDDIFKWDVMMVGPDDTPYEGGTWCVRMHFPAEYPFKPPKVAFVTKIYHPSVKMDSGEICADVIIGEWSPVQNGKHIVQAIRDMMINFKDSAQTPLEAEIGAQLQNDEAAFVNTAREW